jgi:hypothetical protein
VTAIPEADGGEWRRAPKRKRSELSHAPALPIRISIPAPKDPKAPAATAAWEQPPLLISEQQGKELGEYIARDVEMFESQGWEALVRKRRGKSDLASSVATIRHPAGRMLKHLQMRGASVPLTTIPWSPQRVDEAVERGPHKSAVEYAEFLKGEMLDFVQKGQWIVLPLKTVRKDSRFAKLLRVNPMGVVPQRERRPRIIVDYTFGGLNAETLKLAPPEAMQFGKALERILRTIVEANPRFGPVQLIKVDIADGFYRIWLNLQDIPKMAVAIPQLAGEEPLLALPLVLPMGWTESPPYFCVATETVADMANKRAINRWVAPAHRLDDVADTPPPVEPFTPLGPSSTALDIPPTIPRAQWRKRILSKFDVFVDDLVGTAQGSAQQLQNARRILLHTLDEVFRPLEKSDGPHRKEPASVKKLKQGDGYWCTRKMVLGWIIDTVQMTIELPPHRMARLQTLLASIPPHQKRTTVKKWQQLLGELRSMTLALPGSRGLFSLLQEALRHHSDGRIRLSQGVHHAISDFHWLANELATRPTRLFEIVPQPEPELLGAADASGLGMGGVWFPLTPQLKERAVKTTAREEARKPPLRPAETTLPGPLLWRVPFSSEIRSKLVSSSNPQGTITNSDLELAATIVQNDIAAQCFDIRERTIASGSDNTPAVSWQRKGSTTTTGPAAHLLRIQALHQRFHRYHASNFYIPGPVNTMADDPSRLWSLCDTRLLTRFDTVYSQDTPWRIVAPNPELISSVTSALLRQRPATASFLHVPTPTIARGNSGHPSAESSSSTPGSLAWGIRSSSSKSSPTDIASGRLRPVGDKSSLAQWKAPSARWVRPLQPWGPRTPA